MARIHQSSPQNRLNYLHRLGNSAYLDPEQFLFDKNAALLLANENCETKTDSKPKKETNSLDFSWNKLNESVKKYNKKQDIVCDDKLYELKDTSELVSEIFTKCIEPIYEPSHSDTDSKKTVNPISLHEFTELANKIFAILRNSIVNFVS